jgi:mannose-6-phosphate isomerase
MATGPFVLENPVLNYAWGSRTAIGEFLGRPSPNDQPEAELWIGAHPKAPSRVIPPPDLGTLDLAIQNDPVGMLGHEICDHLGNELPFLLKVLAAAEPLSIQAHPDHDQAREGWARENAEGIPVDAPRRNYRDSNHKPELVCALTPFTTLIGFRYPDDLARLLDPIAGPELEREVGRLGRERNPAALRALFTRLMTLEADEREAVLARALPEATRRATGDPAWAWVERLHARYPGDIGTLSPLYLNLITLAPEEALFLPAGELHTYLEGTALEIMANSDNVLRGGLTPKNVDVPELLGILDFDSGEPEILRGHPTGPEEKVFRTEAREFELSLVQVVAETPFTPEPGRGVEVLLGIEGDCVLLSEGPDLPLGRGRAVFVPASVASYQVGGEGRLARASVPAPGGRFLDDEDPE